MDMQRAVAESEGQLLTKDQHENIVKDINNSNDHYTTSKSVSQNMLNLSSIQGLIVILLNVASLNRLNGFQTALVVCVCVSMSLQFVIFVFLVTLAKSRTEEIGGGCCATTATSLNSTVTSLSGLLLIVTSAVTTLAVYAPTTSTTPIMTTTLVNATLTPAP